jgi:hypothetical protein
VSRSKSVALRKRSHCSLVSVLVLKREDDHRGDWSGTSAQAIAKTIPVDE